MKQSTAPIQSRTANPPNIFSMNLMICGVSFGGFSAFCPSLIKHSTANRSLRPCNTNDHQQTKTKTVTGVAAHWYLQCFLYRGSQVRRVDLGQVLHSQLPRSETPIQCPCCSRERF